GPSSIRSPSDWASPPSSASSPIRAPTTSRSASGCAPFPRSNRAISSRASSATSSRCASPRWPISSSSSTASAASRAWPRPVPPSPSPPNGRTGRRRSSARTRMESVDRTRDRSWAHWAVTAVEADANRSADTHLLPFPLPEEWGVDLYLKDESAHPTGSLKHRLARSLFLYAVCNGWLDAGTTVVEACSGSTAVSEAYFARMLGLPFLAVMPVTTSRSKIAQIEFYGGRAHLVEEAATVVAEAKRLAAETGGHFMDQFTYAERATDWRGNNNIAESIFTQMRLERHPVPAWIVVGAGTGGTSATMGRYVRYRCHDTRLCVVDPEHSAFFAGCRDAAPEAEAERGSRIQGIGRERNSDAQG